MSQIGLSRGVRVIGLLALGLASAADAADPRKSVAQAGTPSTNAPAVILYSQNDNASTASSNSQNFEAANNAFDNQLADDFIVPASGWSIDNVTVTGVYFNGPGPAATVHVQFFNNSGTLPGTAVGGCDYPAVVPVGGPSFSLNLAPACVLTAGTYWVSVQANMDFTPFGQWGWTDRTVIANNPSVWQNPGGGFGAGCLTWGVKTVCIVGSVGDLMFSLSGTVVPVELQNFSVE